LREDSNAALKLLQIVSNRSFSSFVWIGSIDVDDVSSALPMAFNVVVVVVVVVVFVVASNRSLAGRRILSADDVVEGEKESTEGSSTVESRSWAKSRPTAIGLVVAGDIVSILELNSNVMQRNVA